MGSYSVLSNKNKKETSYQTKLPSLLTNIKSKNILK